MTQASRNLAHDIILIFDSQAILYVSTAAIPREEYFGNWTLIETWVFSKIKGLPSRQRVHATEEHAVRFHNRLVRFIRRKYEAIADAT